PGVFKTASGEAQRPNGAVYAWVDAFLLPEPSQSDLPNSGDLKGTLDDALQERKKTGQPQFVFVDFTGVTCTNCKYNERNVFTRGEMRRLFKNYRLVQL